MSRPRSSLSLVPLLFFLLLAATAFVGCGGEGSDGPAVTSARSGVAVDPYIQGAVFQEVADDGTLVQRESSPSDDQGHFQFPARLRVGSTVAMKPGARGLHAGAPFSGLLKRAVRDVDAEPLVVSPLTTLLANGIAPEDLLQVLSAAGFGGLSQDDLFADPMLGLTERTGEVAEAELRLLQANMAAMALLTLAGDLDLGADSLADPGTAQLLEDLAHAVRTTLNPLVHSDLATEAGAEAHHPFTLGDAIQVAARLQREFVARLHQGPGPQATREAVEDAVDAVMGSAGPMARSVYEARTGIVPGSPEDLAPAPDPGSPPAGTPDEPGGPQPGGPDGFTLYDTRCASCHKAGAEDPAGFAPDLAGLGALVAPKLLAGHQGVALSGAEVEALAAWLDQLTVPTDPTDPTDPPPPASCTACHGMPPSGTSFPNTGGAHAVHAALPTVGADCSACHLGAAHNGAVDLSFPPAFDGRRGPATDNLDGTCSNVSCHGGQTTSEWWTGSIAVDVQCRSCHAAGTGEDNGYSSGRHTLHVQNRGYDCTVCHSTARLEGLHFPGLDTPGRQRVAASTVGGSDTRVTAYSSETRNCSTQGCHGSKRW